MVDLKRSDLELKFRLKGHTKVIEQFQNSFVI